MSFREKITLHQADLFLNETTADLIVCNPPWLPARPTSEIEKALYDENSQMLKSFLKKAPAHLNSKGEVWLILSDLAERLELRAPNELEELFHDASLKVLETRTTTPTHKKAKSFEDALGPFRAQEVTRLFRLSRS